MEKELLKAFNEQIVREFYSAYLYLSMSAYFERLNLTGFARWMRIQAKEEVEHAMKLYDHLVDRDEEVKLGGIEPPPSSWDSPLEAFKSAYEHEKSVTEHINNLVELSVKYNDHAAFEMLQWFVKEQVEEEKITSEIVSRLKLAKDNSSAILLLDIELGKRES